MRPTLVHLPPELIEQLDKRATREGASRSQVIRDAVSEYLGADSNLAERVAAAYEAYPLGTSDEWGDLESFLDAVRTARARNQ